MQAAYLLNLLIPDPVIGQISVGAQELFIDELYVEAIASFEGTEPLKPGDALVYDKGFLPIGKLPSGVQFYRDEKGGKGL